ncbi:hypothetical protein [Massilia sp. 9I]|uniref:hypothetical protein n=1 Tax=Massilia sp. 9I TaxID=2653152 RepID=UPI001914E632|nr:hypothetical protein [Massilia sp. 9I]
MLNRVAAGAADADNFDNGSQCCVIDHIELHIELPIFKMPLPFQDWCQAPDKALKPEVAIVFKKSLPVNVLLLPY